MIKKNRKNLKIALSTGMSLFSLLATFTAVFAWFTLNQSVGATGMAIKATDDGLSFSSLTVHRCIKNASTSSVLQFYEEEAYTYGASDNPADSLDLPYYSDLLTTEPVLLLFAFEEHTAANSITINAETSLTSMTTQITSSNHNSFPFSSAVYFKTKAYTSNSFPFTNVVVSELSELKSFVTMSNGVNTGFINNVSLYESSSTTEITYIAVIMDYYEDALSYIFSQNLGTTYDLSFRCDFGLSVG